jgi:hypothetical protein
MSECNIFGMKFFPDITYDKSETSASSLAYGRACIESLNSASGSLSGDSIRRDFNYFSSVVEPRSEFMKSIQDVLFSAGQFYMMKSSDKDVLSQLGNTSDDFTRLNEVAAQCLGTSHVNIAPIINHFMSQVRNIRESDLR